MSDRAALKEERDLLYRLYKSTASATGCWCKECEHCLAYKAWREWRIKQIAKQELVPFPEANKDGPAGCVVRARDSGWTAWYPGTNVDACRRISRWHYEHGIEPPEPGMRPVLRKGVWYWVRQ